MNLATTPPNRSTCSVAIRWKGARNAPTSSISSDSERLVNPTTSANSTVTTRRSSRAGRRSPNGEPHSPQNLIPSAFAVPHSEHRTMGHRFTGEPSLQPRRDHSPVLRLNLHLGRRRVPRARTHFGAPVAAHTPRARRRVFRLAATVTQRVTHHPQSSSQSQICTVLKTGSGRQGHSWVRIPSPPLVEPKSAWLSRLCRLAYGPVVTCFDPLESAGIRRLYTWGAQWGRNSCLGTSNEIGDARRNQELAALRLALRR